MYDRLFPTGPLLIERVERDVGVAAVKRWHYSRSMPSADIDVYGVWESDRFVGAVIFGIGATARPGTPYDLESNQLRELCRVALDTHTAPVTQVVAEAIRLLRRDVPDVELIVSFADENQGHLGVIYQAGNWYYAGVAVGDAVRLHGKLVHPRTLTSTLGSRSIPWLRAHVDPHAEHVRTPPKHRYLMPLSRRMKKQLAPLRHPYPKTLIGNGPITVPTIEDCEWVEPVPVDWSQWEPITTIEQEAFF